MHFQFRVFVCANVFFSCNLNISNFSIVWNSPLFFLPLPFGRFLMSDRFIFGVDFRLLIVCVFKWSPAFVPNLHYHFRLKRNKNSVNEKNERKMSVMNKGQNKSSWALNQRYRREYNSDFNVVLQEKVHDLNCKASAAEKNQALEHLMTEIKCQQCQIAQQNTTTCFIRCWRNSHPRPLWSVPHTKPRTHINLMIKLMTFIDLRTTFIRCSHSLPGCDLISCSYKIKCELVSMPLAKRANPKRTISCAIECGRFLL